MADTREPNFARYTGQLTEQERTVWRTFSLAHNHLIKTFDDALRDEMGVSLSEYEVLHALAAAPDGVLRMAELSDRLLFTRGGVTRVVSRLEARGYLQRGAVDDDHRGVAARLTEEGHALFVAAARGHVARLRAQFFEPIGRDVGALHRVIGRLLEN